MSLEADVICDAVRAALVSEQRTMLEETLIDFLRGYMRHQDGQVAQPDPLFPVTEGLGKARMAIHATITRCRHGQSLVVLDSRPFNGMEARPHELRLLAQQLIALADMAAKLPTGGKHFMPTKVTIGENHGS